MADRHAAETHLSMIAMILGGVFDQVPESLRICFAHGGGSFPFWLGRLENAWHERSDVIAHLGAAAVGTTSPGSVSTRWCSTRRRCGCWSTRWATSQVMVGSDYPYPLGERPAGDVVERADFLTPEQRADIRSSNPRRFLGLA